MRKGICRFNSTVWVDLKKEDALTLKKGEPIIVQGPISYESKIPFIFGGPNCCIAIRVYPPLADHLLGIYPEYIIYVPISDKVRCSVGQFKSLAVRRGE
jgi:hypothetical protein